jgi:hypothetical protein
MSLDSTSSQSAASIRGRNEEGSTIASVLGDLGKDRDFGDLATRGRAETTVVQLLARHAQ